jgi:hypothetical protein
MTRLLITFAGWIALALAFVAVARWLRRRAHGARSPRPIEPPGPPLAGTEVPLPAPLAPLREVLEPLLSTAATLAPGGEPVARLGGAPRLPPEVAWPASPARPMSFVGELDLAALHRAVPEAAPTLPWAGRLALFYDVEEMPWGYEPAHGAYFKVLHLDGEGAPIAAPAGATAFTERVLGARCARTLPDLEDLPAEGRLEAEPAEAYLAHATALVGEPDHRVGGHPAWIQDDAREAAAIVTAGGSTAAPREERTPVGDARATRAGLGPAAAKVWRLVWQIDTDGEAGFMWGDGGRLYLLARDEDLKARRFDRAWLVMQS